MTLRWTEGDLAKFEQRTKGKVSPIVKPKRPRPRHKPGEMNKTETRYSVLLESMKATGHVIAWEYEPLRFKLGQRCTLTPDFLVVTPEQMEIHEIKGHREDDAIAKFRAAAARFPYFAWKMIGLRSDGWHTILDL